MTTVPEPSIFTKIIQGQIPGFIPYQTETIAVLIALEGHILIVPKIQYKDIYELPDEIASEIMQIAVRVSQALKKSTNCEGINLVQSNGSVAGQEVFHFHLHIKPRFKNDGVIFKWDTNTVPENVREKLCADLQNIL